MSTERKALLDGIGFDWDPVESRWELMFIELTHFKNKHGHCNVSEKENVELAGWVMRQRDAKVRRKLSTDRKARLDEIGFVWDPARELAWETMFSALKNYIEKFGDPNVPDKWSESLKLASWVGTQRMHKRKNRLSADREARLDGIGFSWNLRFYVGGARFADLVLYKGEHGNCNVLTKWPQNPPLGAWVSMQRKLANAGKLSPARKARLDTLGFDWVPQPTTRRPAAE